MKAYKTAYKVLSEKKDLLEKVVKKLTEKETLEQEEFYKLIDIQIPRE